MQKLRPVLSLLALATLAACNESPNTSPLRDASVLTASNDRGGPTPGTPGTDGGPGPSANSGPGSANSGPGNANNNNNNNNNQQRTRTIVLLAPPATTPVAPRAKGKAQLDVRVDETQLEIEVEGVAMGTVVNFFIGTTQIGTATVGVSGEVELSLNSRNGDTIPAIPVGTVVSAQTADGHVIVTGTF